MTDTSDPTKSVVIERTVDAPISLVWQMWTDPEQFAAWYGPQGASIPVANMDVRVGGSRFVGMEMNTPDGTMQMFFTGEYLTVDEHVKLVYTESMADADGNVKSPADMGMPDGHPTTTEVTVDLASDGDATKMVLTHAGVPAGSPGEMGWQMALDKLDAHVAAQSG